MINKFARKAISITLFTFMLTACGEREVLAPVVELKWRELNSNAKEHVVVRGETLYAVAFRYDQDYRQLAAVNHLRSPYTLRVGQVLYLRTTRRYPVVTRQTVPVRRIETTHYMPQRSIDVTPNYNGWMWPVRGRVVANYLPQQGQKGIDIAGQKGEKIHAAASGTVAYAGNGLAGYGNLIIIKHNDQYLTAYGNNLHNLVKEGQHISQGQIIADMGVVDRRYWGVHFEIRKSGKPVNPLNYLKK